MPVSEAFGSLEFPTFKKFLWSVHDHIFPHERNNYHPHILGHRVLALLSVLVVTIKIASVSFVAMGPAAISEAAAITNETIISLANDARVQNGLSELTPNALLSKAAQNKANDMLAKQYFSHNTPDGATPWSFIKAVGYSYTTAGENLAIDFTEAENIQSAWMNSPGHRANILNKNFQEIGIGISKGTFDNHQTTIVVQMFGTPLVEQVALQEEPTVVAPAPAPVPEVVQPITPATTPADTAPVLNPTFDQPKQEVNTQTAEPILQPIEILDTKTQRQGSQLYIEVQTSTGVVKLLAFFGEKSIMLDPISDTLWKGTIPISSIGQYDKLTVQAQDMSGALHQKPIAEFSQELASLTDGNVEGAQVTIFGATFNPKIWEQKTLLLILAGLITALIIAIAVRRHVQHLSLIANTSFVAMLIAMLMLV